VAPLFPDGGDAQLLEEVSDLLHRVGRQLRIRAHAELGPVGLTPAQARALRTLGRSDRPLRMSELAQRLRIARRSATSVVDELVTRGFVRRVDDPTDRRATAVEVTGPGRDVLARLVEVRHRALAELAADLPPERLLAFRDTLAALDRRG